jgi:Flp pilus assembly protein TadG
MCRIRATRGHPERGAAAIIVSIFVATGVLIGLLAMTVDVGALFNERRLLQNGADTASVAVATACAKKTSDCTSSVASNTSAKLFANLNAGTDQVSGISEICGYSNGAAALSTCKTAGGATTWDCQANTKYPSYARVRTLTQASDGTNTLPTIFARALTPNTTSTTVHACAQAAWGAPGSAGILFPLALSACDFKMDSNATIFNFKDNFKPGQGRSCSITDANGVSHTYRDTVTGSIYLQIPGDNEDNEDNEDNGDNGDNGDCSTPKDITVNSWVSRETNIVQLCSSRYATVLESLLNKVLAIPVFDKLSNSGIGSSLQVHIDSFVAFTFKGYKLKGNRLGGIAPAGGWPSTCKSNQECFFGTFGRSVQPGSIEPNNPNFGLVSVQLIP